MLIPAGSAPWGVEEAGIYVCAHVFCKQKQRILYVEGMIRVVGG